MRIHIIGGGIIGLCSAWYLRQAGFDITVVDKTNLTEGCSYGNAGMIVPSHFMPLASPGVIAKGVRWLFDAKSPFFIKPRVNAELLQWLWQFYRSCSTQNVAQATPVLYAYNAWSRLLYKNFANLEGFQFCFEEKGLLMLSKTAKAHQEEIELAEKAHELGMKTQILSATEAEALEGVALDVAGGVFYPSDAHLYPNLFMQEIIHHLQQEGVEFLTGKAVIDFDNQKEKLSHIVLEDGEKVPVQHLLIAAGSWSAKVLQKLGLKILLQDGKGYSVTLSKPSTRPAIPTILGEAKVAVTPMGEDLRIGGTLEISNLSSKINRNRLAGILESIPKYFPDIELAMPDLKTVWHGFRPCTPDGLPYIGHAKKYKNLTIATGHAMMGMSLGPATGKLVAEIMQDKKTSIPIDLFMPERF